MATASGPLRVRRTADDALVCPKLTLGESFSQRLMGLMGRASLASDEGLYLETSSIHMMFMRFPIDALFLGRPEDDGTRRVVAMRKELPPWRGLVLPIRGAHSVLELPAGTLERLSVTDGDRVVFEASATAHGSSTAA